MATMNNDLASNRISFFASAQHQGNRRRWTDWFGFFTWQ
jgi:hypothetical protein